MLSLVASSRGFVVLYTPDAPDYEFILRSYSKSTRLAFILHRGSDIWDLLGRPRAWRKSSSEGGEKRSLERDSSILVCFTHPDPLSCTDATFTGGALLSWIE